MSVDLQFGHLAVMANQPVNTLARQTATAVGQEQPLLIGPAVPLTLIQPAPQTLPFAQIERMDGGKAIFQPMYIDITAFQIDIR